MFIPAELYGATNQTADKPEVGMKCTECLYTDRYAGTIHDIQYFKNGKIKSFRFTHDHFTMAEGGDFFSDQKWIYTTVPLKETVYTSDGKIAEFGNYYTAVPLKKRGKDGMLKQVGWKTLSGNRVYIGKGETYQDPCFLRRDSL